MSEQTDPVTLAHAAASAISLLCATLDDCAREVQERGGQRVARSSLSHDQSAALSALRALARSLPSSALAGQAAEEVLHGKRRHARGYVFRFVDEHLRGCRAFPVVP